MQILLNFMNLEFNETFKFCKYTICLHISEIKKKHSPLIYFYYTFDHYNNLKVLDLTKTSVRRYLWYLFPTYLKLLPD